MTVEISLDATVLFLIVQLAESKKEVVKTPGGVKIGANVLSVINQIRIGHSGQNRKNRSHPVFSTGGPPVCRWVR